LSCIGLEAATGRVNGYSRLWGIQDGITHPAMAMAGWRRHRFDLDPDLTRLSVAMPPESGGFRLLRGGEVPVQVVQAAYDALRGPIPRSLVLVGQHGPIKLGPCWP